MNLLSPCRFNLPLTGNDGEPIDPRVIIEAHRELLKQFGGFTIHPTSQGRWQSRAGRLYHEEVVVYEVAVLAKRIAELRDLVARLGRQLKQLAMYFDAPLPSVEIIDLSGPSDPATLTGGSDEPGPVATARRRGKRNRSSS